MQINYNFNASLTNKNAPAFAMIANYSIQPISNDDIYLINPSQNKTLVLKGYMGFVVDQLQVFRSEAEHLKVICAAMDLGPEAHPDIIGFFKQLREAGFLVTATQKMDSLKGAASNLLETPPVVIVRTCGRVQMLKRFLISAAKNESQHFADYHYFIIDDSPKEQAEANAINIQDSGLLVTHFDKPKQLDYLNHLKGQFPDHAEAIDFLLGSHELNELATPYGRSWNWGMMLSAGRAAVFLDDDCLLQAYASPLAPSEMASFATSNKDIAFLSKDHAIGEQLKALSLDPIASLAAQLGLSVSALNTNDKSFDNASSKLLSMLQAESKVMLTTQGIAGEPGTSSSAWLYNLSPDSEKRFIGNSEGQYQHHKTNRFAWTGYAQPRVSLSDTHSMVARAIDNRRFMPATMPIMRNEDAIFTHLINHIYPHDVTYENNWAIEHLPEIERVWKDSDLDQPFGFSLGATLGLILGQLKTESSYQEPELRLMEFADKLAALSQQTEAQFKAWLYTEQQSYRAMRVHLLHEQLASRPQNADYWKKDLQRQIEASVQSDELLLPDELSVAALQKILTLFAESLRFWPQLWAFAAASNKND